MADGGFAIGSVDVGGRAVLAPMSGISDLPFRQLAAEFGAPLVVSEMIASERLVARETEARLKAEGDGLDMHVVQLAGCRADDLAEAARLAEAAGAHVIDINMGCPQKRVVGGLAGSALMRDVPHAAALIAATVAAVSVPVTVKMRLGFDRRMMNAPELARRAEAEGAQLVTVHGRTRCQRFLGSADWAAIRATRAAIALPLVANGDICSPADAVRAKRLSGADAVMVGRAALGAPWLLADVAAAFGPVRRRRLPPRTPAELGALAQEHLERLVAHAGVALGMRLARKHVAAYAERLGRPDLALRRAALTAEAPATALAAIAALFAASDALVEPAAALADAA